jgi:hypothetical protein
MKRRAAESRPTPIKIKFIVERSNAVLNEQSKNSVHSVGSRDEAAKEYIIKVLSLDVENCLPHADGNMGPTAFQPQPGQSCQRWCEWIAVWVGHVHVPKAEGFQEASTRNINSEDRSLRGKLLPWDIISFSSSSDHRRENEVDHGAIVGSIPKTMCR